MPLPPCPREPSRPYPEAGVFGGSPTARRIYTSDPVSDPNEELVRRWLELRGFFVRTNLPYYLPSVKGAGWSDVDICAIHPHTGDALAVEVKGWHTGNTTLSTLADPSHYYFARPEASAAIEALFGHSNYRRILVVGRIGPKLNPGEALQYVQSRGVDEIVEFPTILDELVSLTPKSRSAGSDLEHAIRVLKVYGLLPDDGSTPHLVVPAVQAMPSGGAE